MRKHQVTWLPCELEALGIAAALKHFSPFIIQSLHPACVLTDSKPCVQAIEKLRRGEFSASPRVTSFLSIASQYQVNIRHLAGTANIPSDFSSRNAPDCNEPKCQICSFIATTEDSVVRSTSVQAICHLSRLPFTTRSAWLQIQSDCPDLRRTHSHLKQGTRPSKKLTNIKDVKRYLNVVSIARDGLLVVRQTNPLSPSIDLIVIPRSVLDGLVTALHIKLNHPSKHQLQLVMKRNFYALDMPNAIARVCETCHTCTSLRHFPQQIVEHSTEDPPVVVGVSYAADVLKRCKQSILVLRETTTSFTTTSIIPDEKANTLRDTLTSLCSAVHPLEGLPAIIRVDPAPGFTALRDDHSPKDLRISLELGRVKNKNKNAVAEKAIAEVEKEILGQNPNGGPVTALTLALSTSRLNSRLRRQGLSAYELWTHRNQFTREQLPISDRDTILEQHRQRKRNHPYSERSKNMTSSCSIPPTINVGDLVYLCTDRDRTQPRNRYLVTSRDGQWCLIKKFSGNQLRSTSYKVKTTECQLVSNQLPTSSRPYHQVTDSELEDDDMSDEVPSYLSVDVPSTLTLPANNEEPPTVQELPVSHSRPLREHRPPKYYGYEN